MEISDCEVSGRQGPPLAYTVASMGCLEGSFNRQVTKGRASLFRMPPLGPEGHAVRWEHAGPVSCVTLVLCHLVFWR